MDFVVSDEVEDLDGWCYFPMIATADVRVLLNMTGYFHAMFRDILKDILQSQNHRRVLSR